MVFIFALFKKISDCVITENPPKEIKKPIKGTVKKCPESATSFMPFVHSKRPDITAFEVKESPKIKVRILSGKVKIPT